LKKFYPNYFPLSEQKLILEIQSKPLQNRYVLIVIYPKKLPPPPFHYTSEIERYLRKPIVSSLREIDKAIYE